MSIVMRMAALCMLLSFEVGGMVTSSFWRLYTVMFTLRRISVAERRYGHHYSNQRSDYRDGGTAGAILKPKFLTEGLRCTLERFSERHTSSHVAGATDIITAHTEAAMEMGLNCCSAWGQIRMACIS